MRCKWILLSLLVAPLLGAAALAQTSNVLVCFTTTNATPLNSGFAGFTTELLGTATEYGDTNLQHFSTMLSPGWLLFPAGTTGDAFNWATGLTDSNWVYQIGMTSPGGGASNLTWDTYNALIGKGGAMFTNFSSLAQNVGGAKIIVCVNGFTDSAQSAGAFAAFALSNHIPVAAWELCNEPYLFQGAGNFFTNGTDYANKMLPYRNAIKAADSNAVVAVFFSDPALSSASWDNDLKNYPTQYWDAVVYHHYPALPASVPFADLMALDNGVLFSNTTLYVTNVLISTSGPSTTFFETEFNPARGDGSGGQYPPTSTLYGGIYGAEYVMRLSAVPRMTFAGSYQLANACGVNSTSAFWNAVTRAAADGYVTNTQNLPFGYFLSAQGSGEAVAYWAINRSTAVYPTSVGTNCPTVFMDTNGLTTMPALYAQAYQGGNGKRYVVLTNKGSNSVPVQITQDDSPLTNQFLESYVTGTDPSVTNWNPSLSNVVIQTAVAANPLTIPEYSVVRLEWSVFNVPAPTLNITSTPPRTLQWTGLTNVVYDVLAAPSLLSTWATIGKVSGAQTNFVFTDPGSGTLEFYRLSVP
jgi:hypothetical protein